MTPHDHREQIRTHLAKALAQLETIPARWVGLLRTEDATKLYAALRDLQRIESNLWHKGAQLRAKAHHDPS